ncbi:hypothetical protein VNO77_14506 [Canavalia gladiata]|uniref:Uncharacterized protein n=1 Tax=Canavalia gladiata TaxID=3824 RepID=A0AAN9LYR1_CANGL
MQRSELTVALAMTINGITITLNLGDKRFLFEKESNRPPHLLSLLRAKEGKSPPPQHQDLSPSFRTPYTLENVR